MQAVSALNADYRPRDILYDPIRTYGAVTLFTRMRIGCGPIARHSPRAAQNNVSRLCLSITAAYRPFRIEKHPFAILRKSVSETTYPNTACLLRRHVIDGFSSFLAANALLPLI